MPVIELILLVLDIYFWIIIAMVVMSWLMAFNILNPTNHVVRQIRYALYRLTEPLLGPIRRFMPDLGGIDISPVILLILLWFVQNLVITYGPRWSHERWHVKACPMRQGEETTLRVRVTPRAGRSAAGGLYHDADGRACLIVPGEPRRRKKARPTRR
jgi:YggT family protein